MTFASTPPDPVACRHRTMRGPVLVAFTAVVLMVLAGCSLAPSGAQGPQPVEHLIVGQLQALPGVESAEVERDATTGFVNLRVRLAPDANATQIGDIGVVASGFPESEFAPGSYPGEVALELQESVYSYFSLAGEQALRDQLSYWHSLAGTGLAAVKVETYTPPPVQGEQPGQTGASGVTFSNSQLGRIVTVTLPEGLDEQGVTGLFGAVRAVPDPGAASGEWAVLGLTASSGGYFSSARFPGDEDLRLFTEITGIFEGLGAPDTLRFELNRSASPQLKLNVVAFDEALEGVPAERAEEVFQSTVVWQQLKNAVAHMDGTRFDFGVSIMSNLLADASNFRLEVSVVDCAFAFDEHWMGLSEELSRSWLSVREQREPGSTSSGSCKVRR